ncbi:aldose 1-epimerase [Maricaulis sp.]|uniref:aldose 1-epimerase n=1 Tax=Maricaulis sp. TaxID=1486257 RepID=UPI0025C5FAC3|nr:aldose 1-epimerase [Maricaulis sp.]
MLRLVQAGYELELCPQLGGAVTALRWQGRNILRSTPAKACDVLATASFPLIPFANRIADARFDWQGVAIHLPVLPGFEPHALHGDGWQSPWSLIDRDEDEIVLGLDHPASAWPWHWSARQRFSLSETGLEMVLSLTNLDSTDMPAGLGFHPYFAISGDRTIRFRSDHVWLARDDMIPVQRTTPGRIGDFCHGLQACGRKLIDHCYSGWDGRALVTCEAGPVRVSASPDARHLHVFIPPGEDFACLEPVTHRPDVINGPAGEMPALAPGDTRSITMRIALDSS